MPRPDARNPPKSSRRWHLGAVIGAALFPGSACLPAGDYFGNVAVPRNQVLRVTNGDEPRSLDPHKVAGVPEQNIMLNLYDCLTTYDPETSRPIPCLAESWEPNADATVWTFHLRRDAAWTDGAPVTAEDFVYSWRRVADPATASPYAGLMYYVKNGRAINERATDDVTRLGVRAPDPYTLEVTMEQPTAFFVSMTPQYVFTAVPRQAIEKYGDRWLLPEHHVSSGPFRLVERVPYDRVVLERWDGHWDAARVKLRRVVFYPTQDLNTVVNLYKSGEVAITWGTGQAIPVTFVKALRDKKDFHAAPQFSTYYYALNVNKPPMNDATVRHALNLAIDKRLICEKIMQAGQTPATTFVAAGMPGYPYPAGEAYDPERARRLLAEAGYPGGAGFPPIEIVFNTNESHRQIAEAIQSMWKTELGIGVVLTNMEWQAYLAYTESREYNGVARAAWTGDYLDPNSFLDLLASDALTNRSGWVDPRYTAMIDAANREVDGPRRLGLLAGAEAYMLEAMPVIPIYHYAGMALRKPWLRGWYENALDQHPLKYVWIDESWREGGHIAALPVSDA
jgi:oligopeptide transport system substrate-binding protein